MKTITKGNPVHVHYIHFGQSFISISIFSLNAELRTKTKKKSKNLSLR